MKKLLLGLSLVLVVGCQQKEPVITTFTNTYEGGCSGQMVQAVGNTEEVPTHVLVLNENVTPTNPWTVKVMNVQEAVELNEFSIGLGGICVTYQTSPGYSYFKLTE